MCATVASASVSDRGGATAVAARESARPDASASPPTAVGARVSMRPASGSRRPAGAPPGAGGGAPLAPFARPEGARGGGGGPLARFARPEGAGGGGGGGAPLARFARPGAVPAAAGGGAAARPAGPPESPGASFGSAPPGAGSTRQPSASSSIRARVSSPMRRPPRGLGRRVSAIGPQPTTRRPVPADSTIFPSAIFVADILPTKMPHPRFNDRYRAVRPLGSGTQARVWLVEDRARGGALRAAKRLGEAGDAAARARLAAEFRRLAALDHPNLVRACELDAADDGALFFTAEYVDGAVSTAWIAARPDRVEAVLDVAVDVAAALSHVHRAGLVHRDVKPANVLVRATGEAVLIDLGLAAAPGRHAAAAGSLAYMAPEALAGAADPRSDLFSLGAAIYEWTAGRRPFAGDDPAAIVRAICDGAAPPLADAAGAPIPLSDVVARLLAPDPAARPPSAAALLGELSRVRESLGLPARARDAAAGLLAPALCGRDAAVAAIAAALATGAPRAVRVIGPPGAGRGAAIDAALRRFQLAVAAGRAPARTVGRGALDDALRSLGVAPPAAGASVAAWAERAARALAERARAGAVAVVVDDDRDDPRAAALAAALGAGAAAAADIVAVVRVDAEIDAVRAPPGVTDVAVGPLSPAEVAAVAASMVGRPVAGDWAAAVARATGGLPRAVVEVVRAAAADAGVAAVERADPVALVGAFDATETNDSATALYVRRVRLLAADDAALIEALAVLGGRAALTEVSAVAGQPAGATADRALALAARGFVSVGADGGAGTLALPSTAHADAVAAAMPAPRAAALHRTALRLPGLDAERRARHLCAVGPAAAAVDACLAAAAAAEATGRAPAAFDWTRRAAERASGRVASQVAAALAERALAVARYDDAVAAAQRAARSRDPACRRRGALALARALQKRGDLAAAERALERLRARDGGEDVAAAYARVLVARGRYADAEAVAGRPEDEPPAGGPVSAARAARLEAAGLARLYRGDLAGANAAFARLESAARAADDPALLGRALALLGMVAHTAGEVAVAAERYAAAHAHAQAAGDPHAAAVYALNRAAAASAQGRHADAVAAIDAALVQLRRLDAHAEVAAATYNRGVSLLALGKVDEARRAADRALADARAHGAPEVQAFAQLLAGDVARRAGDAAGARAHYEAAAAAADAHGPARARVLALAALGVALAEAGDPRAGARLDAAAAAAASDEDRDEIAVARARAALAAGVAGPDVAAAVDAARARLRARGRADLAWRADALAARLHLAAGDRGAAGAALADARRAFDAIVAATPAVHRDGVRSDPDAALIGATEAALRAVAAPAAGGAADADAARLRRLLALSRRLNSEQRLEPLLDDVIDSLIEVTDAERGFLLLERDGALEVVVARNFDHSPVATETVQVSRSIAERAARTGEPVLTVDAAFDDRFGEAASVAALRLRSVLAVPLRCKGRIIGTVYLDHRFRRGAFTEQAIDLVFELADIAAVAIENARLADENRRRAEQIAELNARLEADIVRARAELASARARLGDARLRHDYTAIVGRSPAMVRMLEIVDRATETSLPVVLFGESGTGKELVARALHDNGPRAGRPFVAVNCGAVPAELLESELFGHVRGAFTGADRDRPGLFEIADGGTLFLDEVADTSPAMQAKLLRVLQEGELRRVGDARTRTVDVRIVAASNRDLRALVDEGRFREDLFYRLNVISVRIPPLRERVEDIPDLCRALLARVAPDPARPPRLDRAALKRLCAYAWPGNVRELENELARAAALAGDVIGVADLSPAIAHADPAARPPSPDDLRLRPRVEALERALIEEAMARCHGNQTAAAKLLGLSRYGLQKKLKRYGLGSPGARDAAV
ncbi:MAG: GAF domain-containing protein [Deltaproteobacteria bacterium]|nr:MAG: GAF domain-containing protein [Deltaproteobacteria bacterium]